MAKPGRHKKPGRRRTKPPIVRAKRQMPKLLMKCRICEETIASFYPEKLKRPLVSEMFEGIDHTYAKPFYDGVPWVDFVCPYCLSKPFWVTEEIAQAWVEKKGKGPNEILTNAGVFHVDEKQMFTRQGDPLKMKGGWVCKICGMDFEKSQSLSAHMRGHKKKPETNERAVNE
jgi:rubrerythrin